MSLVNKRLNDLAYKLLWRMEQIYVDEGQTRFRWKRDLVRRCDRLTCHPRLGTYIRHLNIYISGPSSGGMLFRTDFTRDACLHLSQVLTALRSLTTLDISVPSKDPSLYLALSSMLSRTAFDFKLVEFCCDSDMVLEGSIYPFLLSQSSIEVFSNINNGIYTRKPLGQLNEARRQEAGPILPSLRKWGGPPALVRTITAGRTLDCVMVETGSIASDLNSVVKKPGSASLSLAACDEFRLSCLDMDYISASQLPTLLTGAYGVASHSIKRLRIQTTNYDTRVVPVLAQLPLRILEEFPNLEALYMETPWFPLISDRREVQVAFVRDISARCARIRKITAFMDSNREQSRTFVRLDRHGDDTVPGVDQIFDMVFQDARGFYWTIKDTDSRRVQ